MQDNKVSGPEDNMVREMIKQLPFAFFMNATCFQERFMGREGSKFMHNCDFVVPEEA